MKTAAFLVAALFLTTILAAGVSIKPEQAVKYAGVWFDHKDNPVFCSGRLSREHYNHWFKSVYPVAGERIETPKDAVAVGALVLTDGDEVLAMPFYRWGKPGARYYACQSAEIGHPPMFRVLEQSEAAFRKALTRELIEASTRLAW